MSKHSQARVDAREIAAEIIRRGAAVDGNESTRYVVRLSNPPTAHERLQLAATRILRRPVAIMPVKCLTLEEWIERFRKF
jgi:uncharacterized protein (DUF1778 family)